MKTNYNLIMEQIINNLEDKPTLLLHACCGVCSSSVIEKLYPFFDITILFYNPNIYPKEEYLKRFIAQKEIIEKMNVNVRLFELGYQHSDFKKIAEGLEDEKEGGNRCEKCFYLRLDISARFAKKLNIEYFTTTLSVSPHKNSEKLNQIGKQLEEKYGVKYLYSDFKKKEGYKRSNALAHQYNIYRQNYCGCEYSLKAMKAIKK